MNRQSITPVMLVFILFFAIIPISCSFNPENNPSQHNYPFITESSSKNDELIEILPSIPPKNTTTNNNIPPPGPTPIPLIEVKKLRDQESRIAFTARSDINQPWFLYVMNEDGTEIENFDDIYGENIIFRWSPDGKKLAVSLVTNSKINELFVLDLETKNRTTLFQESVGVPVTPYWSPNGNYIAYCTRSGELYVASTDSPRSGFLADGLCYNSLYWQAENSIIYRGCDTKSNQKLITITFGSELVEIGWDLSGYFHVEILSRAPDGEYFLGLGAGNQNDVRTCDIIKYFTDGRHPINLTRDQEDQHVNFLDPLLSKSGDQIYFYRQEGIKGFGVKSSIWVMNTDGTNKQLIIGIEGNGGHIKGHNYLSSDGQKIAFVPRFTGEQKTGRVDIFLVTSDGTELVNLTQDLDDMYSIFDFAWSP